MQALSNGKLGHAYKISEVLNCCPIKIKRRLFDLGFLSGTSIRVVRKSLLNKVLLVEIRGYTLSLQKKIADYILIGG